jgi:hypothetical protein
VKYRAKKAKGSPRDLCLVAEQEPGEHEHPAGGSEEREDGEVPGLPAPGLLAARALDAEALGPAQRVHLLEQVELEPFALELGDALAEEQRVLALPLEQPPQDGLGVGLVAQRPEHGEGGEQRDEAGDPGPPARHGGVGGGGGEEEEQDGCGVEGEEGAVEEGDLLARAVEAGLPQRDAPGQQVLFLDPLLQQQPVRPALRDLAQRVRPPRRGHDEGAGVGHGRDGRVGSGDLPGFERLDCGGTELIGDLIWMDPEGRARRWQRSGRACLKSRGKAKSRCSASQRSESASASTAVGNN